MKIMVVHNYYQQSGGEDIVFEAETALLQEKGHEVFTYTSSNHELASNQLKLALNTIWSFEESEKLRQAIRENRPDIVHFHNTFMKISPSAYYVFKKENIPIVQSLHNPRIICPAASLQRDGKVCELCVGKTFAFPSIQYSCYRQSSSATAVVAGMLAFHRVLGTWKNVIDKYIVFTNFYRQKFLDSGDFDEKKLIIKPHFISPDPLERSSESVGEYAVFVGRLDPEKGVDTLLKTWENLASIPLKIRGSGQLQKKVETFIQEHPSHNVQLIDRLSRDELNQLIKGARFLVWPSEGYYETFGLVAAEALACGVPVIASRSGVMQEIVKDGVNGLLFEAGNASDLQEKILRLWEDKAQATKLGHNARKDFEAHYTAEDNYAQLMAIYESVIR